VYFLHDGQEVAPGRLQILELVGQELVALLQRGELFEGKRIDLAEQRQLALRPRGALLLDRPVVRLRLRFRLARVLRGAHLDRGRRHRRLRAVLVEESSNVEPEVLGRLRLELLEPEPLFGAGDLVTMYGGRQPLEVGAEASTRAADLGELGLSRRSRGG